MLVAQRGVTEVFQLAETAPLKIVGIGTVEAETTGHLGNDRTVRDRGDIPERAASAKCLGSCHPESRALTAPTSRTLAVSLDTTRDDRIIALAVDPKSCANPRGSEQRAVVRPDCRRTHGTGAAGRCRSQAV